MSLGPIAVSVEARSEAAQSRGDFPSVNRVNALLKSRKVRWVNGWPRES
jgi:hypothetical protein